MVPTDVPAGSQFLARDQTFLMDAFRLFEAIRTNDRLAEDELRMTAPCLVGSLCNRDRPSGCLNGSLMLESK